MDFYFGFEQIVTLQIMNAIKAKWPEFLLILL